ncbi:unnamed protein product [Soboliphyme baturini]|uniref:Uncharacterized protein n=1 Tax=Soboliphyme baturini TaxID=241478 RepID=A0A183IS69_9BILA|nr:unnamed protein product [Soboliphyme baturini]
MRKSDYGRSKRDGGYAERTVNHNSKRLTEQTAIRYAVWVRLGTKTISWWRVIGNTIAGRHARRLREEGQLSLINCHRWIVCHRCSIDRLALMNQAVGGSVYGRWTVIRKTLSGQTRPRCSVSLTNHARGGEGCVRCFGSVHGKNGSTVFSVSRSFGQSTKVVCHRCHCEQGRKKSTTVNVREPATKPARLNEMCNACVVCRSPPPTLKALVTILFSATDGTFVRASAGVVLQSVSDMLPKAPTAGRKCCWRLETVNTVVRLQFFSSPESVTTEEHMLAEVADVSGFLSTSNSCCSRSRRSFCRFRRTHRDDSQSVWMDPETGTC